MRRYPLNPSLPFGLFSVQHPCRPGVLRTVKCTVYNIKGLRFGRKLSGENRDSWLKKDWAFNRTRSSEHERAFDSQHIKTSSWTLVMPAARISVAYGRQFAVG